MMLRWSTLGMGLVFAFGALGVGIASCVGDDPTFDSTSTGTDSGGGTDGQVLDAGSTNDAAPMCMAGETLCGTSCVVLDKSDDNCGRCGRSCGGATCTAGACGVALLRDNIAGLGGFDIDPTTLYFTSGETIDKCALGACTGAPTQLGDTGQYPAGHIYQDSGFVYFYSEPNQNTERPSLYRCPVSGCDNPLPAPVMMDGLNGIGDFKTFDKSLYAYLEGTGITRADCSSGACAAPALYVPKPAGDLAFAVDAQRIYFNDPSDGGIALSSCPLAAGCTAKSGITTTSVLGPMVVVDSLIYFIGPGLSGGNGVLACPTTGTCSSPTALRKTLDPIPNLAADANGIFWTEGDSLLMCDSIQCVGGPRTLATDLAGPTLLHLDANFVYFANAGTTTMTSAIRRVARP